MNRTISSNQVDLLISISELYIRGPFHLDTCFHEGGFYRDGRLPLPEIKNDLNRPKPGFESFDVQDMPYSPSSIRSIIFDPPFLVGGENGIMISKYGGFRTALDLFTFQDNSLREISRVLKGGGWLVTKIQDFTHGRQKYFPSVYQVIKAREYGLYLMDSFILISKNRMRHERAGRLTSVSQHSFFHVYQKERRKKRIFRY